MLYSKRASLNSLLGWSCHHRKRKVWRSLPFPYSADRKWSMYMCWEEDHQGKSKRTLARLAHFLVWILKYNAKCYRLDTIRDGLTIVAHFLVHNFKKWMISKCHKVDIIEIDVLNNLWQIWNMSKFFCNMDQGNIEFLCILIYYARAKFPLIIWNTVWRFPWMNIILQIWAFCCENREIDLARKEICPHEY